MRTLLILLSLITLTVSAQAADITITIADNKIQSVRQSLCEHYNYQSKIPNEDGDWVDNPETCVQYSRRMLKDYVVGIHKQVQAEKAYRAAREAKEAEINAESF